MCSDKKLSGERAFKKMGLTDKVLSFGTAFSVLLIFLSIYLRDPGSELQERLVNVINGLIEVEHQHIRVSPKVAVGYGACVDLYVDGKDFLPYDEVADNPEHFSELNTLEELYRSYAYYFKHGAASERFMINGSLFDELVLKAESLRGSRYALGGNAPVMASRLHAEGCNVLLGSTLTSGVKRRALHPSIKLVGPDISRDDVHLIVEYKTGERWGPYVSPRSNRYIIHNDVHNPYISSMEDFGKQLKKFSPDLLVVSGLQLMDNYPFSAGIRESKLRGIREQMALVSSRTKVHFEMASFIETNLLNQLKEVIIPYADSLGMNEQELANLYNLYNFGNVSFATDSTPRVAKVLDQMRQVFHLVRQSSLRIFGSRKLTRIHVHTLAYQAVMTDTSATSPSSSSDSLAAELWPHSDIAAAKASLTAFRHVCASSEVDLEKAMLLMDDSFSTSALLELIDREDEDDDNVVGSGDDDGKGKCRAGAQNGGGRRKKRVVLEPERPVSCWLEQHPTSGPVVQMCVAPGLVCTEASQTAGGGDNISAAALAVQI